MTTRKCSGSVVVPGSSRPGYVTNSGIETVAVSGRDVGSEGWLHAHHRTHWADGGPTDLDNLILLCGYHHRFLHEHGWTIENDGYDKPVFRKPDGQDLPADQTPNSTPDSENSSDNEPRGNRPGLRS